MLVSLRTKGHLASISPKNWIAPGETGAMANTGRRGGAEMAAMEAIWPGCTGFVGRGSRPALGNGSGHGSVKHEEWPR